MCGGDGSCDTPQPGELGDFIGAQMAAVNVGNAFPVRPELTALRSGRGAIVSSPAGISTPGTQVATFDAGTKVTLTATPALGYAFNGWNGACTNADAVCNVTLDRAHRRVTGNFLLLPKPVVTVHVTGGGKVRNSVGIDCPASSCTHTYLNGSTVNLTAVPTAGHRFTGWTGACAGTQRACTFVTTSSESATATFH